METYKSIIELNTTEKLFKCVPIQDWSDFGHSKGSDDTCRVTGSNKRWNGQGQIWIKR